MTSASLRPSRRRIAGMGFAKSNRNRYRRYGTSVTYADCSVRLYST